MLRITNQMTSARTLIDQFNHLNRLDKLYNDMSSRYKLHRPSDDPVQVARGLRMTSEISINEMYRQDVLDANSWTSKSDESMKTLNSVMARIKELTIDAASDGKTVEDTRQIKKEIDELKQTCITIANDDYMGRFQFSGYDTTEKFVNDDGTYNEKLYLAGLKYEKMNYNIGVGQKTGINLSGVEIFGNEYFHTSTTALRDVPFDQVGDKEIYLEGSITVTLQKYKVEGTKFDKNGKNYTVSDEPGGKYVTIDPEDLKQNTEESKKLIDNKNSKEEAYEQLNTLTQTDGGTVSITVKFDKNKGYKAKDLTDIINDLNDQLRADPKLPSIHAGQFVNDEGKIGFVSDENYGVKIELSDVKVDGKADANPQWLPNTLGPEKDPSGNVVIKPQMKKPEREMMSFFEMMDRLSQFMDEGNTQGLSRMQEVVEYHENNFLACQGKAGARMNMYTIMDSRAQRINLNYSDVLSRIQDTDYNEAAMKLSQSSFVYSAALSVTAKILQPSLVDFLR